MHRWGYPIRLDILRGMAAEIVEDRKLQNIEEAADFFQRIAGPMCASRRDTDGILRGRDPNAIGKNWHKAFLARHPSLKSVYSSVRTVGA